MTKSTYTIASLLFFGGLAVAAAAVKEIVIDDFKNGLSPHWKSKSFQGETAYHVESRGELHYLAADSKGTASGLYYEIEYSAQEYPVLSWSWKIEHTLERGDARRKAGDDYAARIYVVFPGFFFWQTKALNYVWANKIEKEQFIPNAFTAKAMMIAVESGGTKAGSWVAERRNIVEDYQKAFGSSPPKVGAIAIMTDTDNTKESAKAYYSAIKLLSE